MEACAVCNQFFFEDRKSPTMLELHEAPSGTFTYPFPLGDPIDQKNDPTGGDKKVSSKPYSFCQIKV